MLLSLALVMILGLLVGELFKKLQLPSLFGMIIVGMVLGNYGLGLLDSSLQNISAELRQIALIIILTRSGLALDINDLKKVGRPAVLMCFVPACFEILAVVIFAPMIFGISIIEAGVMGAVLAAVSPAVVVPKMIKLMESSYGTKKAVPQMIMAGASVDDVFVIVLFTVFISLLQSGNVSPLTFVEIPTSIIFGAIGGVVCGCVLTLLFSKIHLRDSVKVIVIVSVAFLLVSFEAVFTSHIKFSGLLGVMAMGMTVKFKKQEVAKRLSMKFSKLWLVAEIMLFVLVGATVNLDYAKKAGFMVVAIVAIGLVFRMVGVALSLIRTKLNNKERLFTMIAYCPKATVQAAIGAIPLSMGLACGDLVLTTAVVSIILSAPIAAFAIDKTYKKLLAKD